jgi:hypothetical protein
LKEVFERRYANLISKRDGTTTKSKLKNFTWRSWS